MVNVVASKADWDTHTGGDKACVVDFFADWCGPCKMIAPKFAELSSKYPTVTFLKVNVDELEEVAQICGISAMPTFQIWKSGQKVDEVVGASPEKLEALIAKHA